MLQGHKDRYNTIIYTSYDNNMDYTLALFSSTEALDIQTTSVNSLSMDETSFLCHQRLCHMHTKGTGKINKAVNGIPTFSSDNDLDGCDVCFTRKMIINLEGHISTRRYALQVKQGLSLYWGFMMQKYHDKERTEILTGMNGDQAYLLIEDHITVKLLHVSYGSNKPTLNWLNRWLDYNTPPNEQNKYVVMYQGG